MNLLMYSLRLNQIDGSCWGTHCYTIFVCAPKQPLQHQSQLHTVNTQPWGVWYQYRFNIFSQVRQTSRECNTKRRVKRESKQTAATESTSNTGGQIGDAGTSVWEARTGETETAVHTGRWCQPACPRHLQETFEMKNHFLTFLDHIPSHIMHQSDNVGQKFLFLYKNTTCAYIS